jgi:hypothetical protein
LGTSRHDDVQRKTRPSFLEPIHKPKQKDSKIDTKKIEAATLYHPEVHANSMSKSVTVWFLTHSLVYEKKDVKQEEKEMEDRN